jgi:hypothetical protein
VRKKILAAMLGGSMLLGTVGLTASPASAQTTNTDLQALITQLQTQFPQLQQLLSRLQGVKLPTLSETQINRLVARVNLAATRNVSLADVKSQLCANQSTILARVPAKYQAKASQAIARVCSR